MLSFNYFPYYFTLDHRIRPSQGGPTLLRGFGAFMRWLVHFVIA